MKSAGRTIIVGDVHGMLDELVRLMEHVKVYPDDTWVFAGDLLDKGPDSVGVVRHLVAMRNDGKNVVLVKGNHEEKHERYRSAVKKSGGRTPDMTGVGEMEAMTRSFREEDITFLDEAVRLWDVTSHRSIVVHAGVLPSHRHVQDLLSLEKGDLQKFYRIRNVTSSAKTKVVVEFETSEDVESDEDVNTVLLEGLYASMKVIKRDFKPEGEFLPLGKEKTSDPFWADVYDGRMGHIYFGHSPFLGTIGPRKFPFATGLDLGCVFGGYLAAAILEPGMSPVFTSVQASKKYASSYDE